MALTLSIAGRPERGANEQASHRRGSPPPLDTVNSRGVNGAAWVGIGYVNGRDQADGDGRKGRVPAELSVTG
ncbi:hypothetical protein EVAR_83529_1 [Eumeta japonica]|uniref:Uncharacterized protein n=1 Tax=Eumeta variegata TaxID=151549 RepID=A0A4C1ZBG8_EUMVA|nr:hypothetical protein EVAR_83529_1 [Eumeta japonica]